MGLAERLWAAWWSAIRGPKYDLAPRAEGLPLRIRRGPGGAWTLAGFFGSVGVALGVGGWVSLTSGGRPAVGLVLGVLGAFGLIGMLLLAIVGAFGFEQWSFEDGTVTRESHCLLGSWNWQEPLSNYRGVVGLRKQKKKGHETTGPYAVELQHGRNPARSVCLYLGPDAAGLHDKVRHYGRLLRAPVLMATEHGTVMRAPEDIDKSVRQLVQEGRMEAALKSEAPPGGAPKLALRGESLAMRIPRAALGPAKVLLVPTGAGALFTVGGFFAGAGIPARWSIASNVGIAFMIFLVLWSIGEELRVSPERVTRCWTWLGVRFGARSVPAERVRDVIAAEQFADARFRSVQIVSPGAVLHFGRILKPPQRRWVRDCIIAVLSRGAGQPQGPAPEGPE